MYRFREDFIRDSCFLPEEWKILKWSGLGYVMLFDYQDSPVGPFHELMIIPGKANLGGSRLRTISKTYVDSVDRLFDGRSNWGIQGDLTDFQWTHKHRRHLIQMGSFAPWLEIRLESGGIPFPVNSFLLPVHLHQEIDGQIFKFSLSVKGRGRFGLIKDIKVDPMYFPELNLLEPLAAIYIDRLRMTFPVAETKSVPGYY